ncbi:MAG: methylated-DNA--[protein]-cysteine S-methyltransferase [Armatimonadota bacterium]|nr:methylated-DNA--[protein]-cysteine S-methyltransferase [Armatimonadota bacterium]
MVDKDNRTYNYTVFETVAGWAAIAGRDGKVSALELPQATREEAVARLGAGIGGQLVESNGEYETLARQLRDYLAGLKTEFTFEPDLAGLTDFQQAVLRTAMTVPYGVVVTYSWIASHAGRPGASRAAGQALGRNPVPIAIPCHRVMASGGGLGGFSSGLRWKERLLKMEGVKL